MPRGLRGVRTRRVAVSFALFNVLVLLSRLSSSFLGPFLAKRIENSLHAGSAAHLLGDSRLILASATAATIVGRLMIPTVQRWFSWAIGEVRDHRSIAKLLLHGFTRGGFGYLSLACTTIHACCWPCQVARCRVAGDSVECASLGASDCRRHCLALCRLSLKQRYPWMGP